MNLSPERTTLTPTPTARGGALAIAVGIAALALAGAALVSLPNTAVAQDTVDAPRLQAHAPGQMRGAERMQRHDQVDQAERAARMVEMAEQFGVDPDALRVTMEALRVDLAADRGEAREALMQLGPEARREAMREFAAGRRTAMIAALEALGVDPDAFAQHVAELQAERRAEHGEQRGPQQRRGAPGMQR